MDRKTFRMRLAVVLFSFSPLLAQGQEEVEFNSNFLMGKSKIDTSIYAKGNPVAAGEYEIQIYLNNKQKLSNTRIAFVSSATSQATPCLHPEMLDALGIDLSKAVVAVPTGESCLAALETYFPGADLVYDPLTLRMDVSVPQLYLLNTPSGVILPSRWDNGIPAILLAYDTNFYHRVDEGTSDTVYAGLIYGANFGAWRLRARGSLDWNSDDNGLNYESQTIYLQRDIALLRAQFIIGDSTTKGDAFDAINIRGMRLYNDSRMYSSSENNYAPLIQGVANSNAKITVTQNGSTVYQTTVPPGPFTLSDVIPNGYGNDLHVTIEEADGSKEYLTVPYSSVPQLMRKNYARWEVAAGELNDDSLGHKPKIAQFSTYYGLSDVLTGYTGLQASNQKFVAFMAGVAFNTPMGAIAADVTHSEASFDSNQVGKMAGESYRVSYSNLVETTQTTFSLAAYRFSTRDYLSLRDAASIYDDVAEHALDNISHYQRMRDQLQLNISQPLKWGDKDLGSFYLSGSWETYWGGYADTQQYSFGYNNSWNVVNYSLSMQRTYDMEGKKNDSVFLNFSVPFSAFTHDHHNPAGFSLLSSGINNDSHGNTQVNTNASGSTEDNKFSYSVNASTGLGQKESTSSASIGTYLTWNSPYGPLNASASTTDGNGSQYSLGNSGGVIVHSGGVTFAPDSIGADNAIALVHADGAEGARLTMGDGEIGGSGYGMATYLSPYRENRVGLNIETLENDVDIKNGSATVVPTSGAVVGVNFETDQGRSVLLMLARNDGGLIPLGASVSDEQGNGVGNIGQAGYAYVRGIGDAGMLTVAWGEKSDDVCHVSYQIPAAPVMADKTIVLSGQQCVMQVSRGNKDE